MLLSLLLSLFTLAVRSMRVTSIAPSAMIGPLLGGLRRQTTPEPGESSTSDSVVDMAGWWRRGPGTSLKMFDVGKEEPQIQRVGSCAFSFGEGICGRKMLPAVDRRLVASACPACLPLREAWVMLRHPQLGVLVSRDGEECEEDHDGYVLKTCLKRMKG